MITVTVIISSAAAAAVVVVVVFVTLENPARCHRQGCSRQQCARYDFPTQPLLSSNDCAGFLGAGQAVGDLEAGIVAALLHRLDALARPISHEDPGFANFDFGLILITRGDIPKL